MILYEDKYLAFIQQSGVGKNDRVASSPKSYLAYLRGVAKLINKDISPALLKKKMTLPK